MPNHICLYLSRRSLYDADFVCLHPDCYEMPVDEDCKDAECPIPKPKEAHI